MTMLPNYAEFKALFAQYRLMAISQEYYFSDTGSVNISDGTYNNTGGKQILMHINPNAVGKDNALLLTEQFFLESQVAKKKVCLNGNGYPVKFYSKLTQLSQVYANELAVTDYAKQRPKFVSTAEDNTEHYGQDIRLERVDGQPFSTGGTVYPRVKIITKVYLQCRQVI